MEVLFQIFPIIGYTIKIGEKFGSFRKNIILKFVEENCYNL